MPEQSLNKIYELQSQMSALLAEPAADLTAVATLLSQLETAINKLATLQLSPESAAECLNDTLLWLSQQQNRLDAEKAELGKALNEVQQRRHASRSYQENSQ